MSELKLGVDSRDEEEQVAQVMHTLLGRLPSGAATLEVKRNSSGLILYLKPANERSAGFGIHYDGCVDIFFGKGTTFELPYESGLAKDADLEATLAWAKVVGLAVIAGNCREYAGFLGIRGTVEIDGKPYVVTSFFHFRLFPKTFHYAPYCPVNLSV